MSKFRKKPVVIDAWQFNNANVPDWICDKDGHNALDERTIGPFIMADGETMTIPTLKA